jgi:hypothetical protein
VKAAKPAKAAKPVVSIADAMQALAALAGPRRAADRRALAALETLLGRISSP